MATNRKNSSSEPRRLDFTLAADREYSFHSNSTRWAASLPSAILMSEAGFYFTPTDKNPDCVTCFRCGIKMFNWLPDDTAKVEHKKFSPACKEVKSWPDVNVIEDDRTNRADQTDSRLRSKISKKLTSVFHRKGDTIRRSNSVSVAESPVTARSSDIGRALNDEERLADIRRQREVAERSVAGLERLASAYPFGSAEQKQAEQIILSQKSDLEKLRVEEEKLIASMGTLSFGRGWHDYSESPLDKAASPTRARAYTTSVIEDEDSPVRRRPLPQLPSQMRSGPRVPAKLVKSQDLENITPEMLDISQPISGYSDVKLPLPVAESEWIEYFTEDGTPYYYSTITKSTTWSIPEQYSSQPVA